MNALPEATVVLGIVLDDLERVLLIRRRGETCWLFPGGKVEPGESQEQAVVREVEEETGIRCRPAQQVGIRVHPDSNRVIAYWRCEPLTRDVSVNREQEIEVARWVDRRDALVLLGQSLYEPVRNMLLDRHGRPRAD